jgi:hypothetical protein
MKLCIEVERYDLSLCIKLTILASYESMRSFRCLNSSVINSMQQEGFNWASQNRGRATIVGRNRNTGDTLQSHATVLKSLLYDNARCLIRFR